MNSHRFATAFPLFYRIISQPVLYFIICIFGSLLAYAVSPHLVMSIWCLYYVLLSYYIDRRHLDYLLLPPLTMLALFEFSRMGIGPPIFSFANNLETDQGLLLMQAAHVVSFPLIMFCYKKITRNVPSFIMPNPFQKNSYDLYLYLKWFGLVCFCFTIFGFFIGATSGSMDRGDAGAILKLQSFGIWSLFEVFIRLYDIAYLLVPIIFLTSGFLMRRCLMVILFMVFIFFIATGTRGFIMFSALYLVLGYWMVAINPRRIITTLAVLIVSMTFLIPFMASYRSSISFSSSKLSDITARLESIFSPDEVVVSAYNDSLLMLSKSLIGVSDQLIYEKTPDQIPHAGWENIDAVLYVWMPTTLFPNKPSLYGSDTMLYDYTNVMHERSFGTITFNADMYRRFGWIGVLSGNILFGLLYGFATKFVFSLARSKVLFGTLLVIFSVGMFRNLPIGTLTRTVWYWLWELPKYMGLLLVIHWFIVRYFKINQRNIIIESTPSDK